MTEIEKIKYLAIDLPNVVKMYHFSGDFKGEIEVIDMLLRRENLPITLRERLLLERDMASCLLVDYRLSAADFIKAINDMNPQRKITEDELPEILKFQNVDYILKEGKPYFQHAAARNVFAQHQDYLSLPKEPDQNSQPPVFDNSSIEKMKQTGYAHWRFRCRESFWLNDSSVQEGNVVNIWLPFPAVCETQNESAISVVSSSHDIKITGDKYCSAFFRVPAKKGDKYYVEFQYENKAKYYDPADVLKSTSTIDDIKSELGISAYEKYTGEQLPQTVFTPYLKALAAEITEGLTYPAEKAYAIYKWIAKNIRYSYLRDYLLIPNIPEFVTLNGYGDCGAMVLVFIALCRICGIPARWQSGDGVRPNHMGPHDWCRFYIAGFGWLYCDPSYGSGAFSSGNKQRLEHYFCNIDGFRLVTCDDFLLDTTPSKKLLRMDPYDNQSGEAEYEDGNKNIFYSDCDWSRECTYWEEL